MCGLGTMAASMPIMTSFCSWMSSTMSLCRCASMNRIHRSFADPEPAWFRRARRSRLESSYVNRYAFQMAMSPTLRSFWVTSTGPNFCAR